MARAMGPEGRLVSVEFLEANAAIARRDHRARRRRRPRDGRHRHARRRRRDDRRRSKSEHGFGPGSLDLVFFDHDKDAYLPDLEAILERGWLHAGSVVVADNIKLPGAPEYRAYMTEREGRDWRTTEHDAHVEYQSLLKDMVLESEYLGAVEDRHGVADLRGDVDRGAVGADRDARRRRRARLRPGTPRRCRSPRRSRRCRPSGSARRSWRCGRRPRPRRCHRQAT